MITGPRILIILIALSLCACSGGSIAAQNDLEAPPLEPAQEKADFPPTWTPTAISTQAIATATPQPLNQSSNASETSLATSLPEATSVTDLMPTDSWQRVEGATASFMLPMSFEVLDMGTEFGKLMAALMTGLMEGMMELASDLGEEFGADPITPTPFDVSELESAFDIDFVLAMQEDQKTSAFLFSEPLEQPGSLEDQIQATLDEQENPIEIVSIARVTDTVNETARLHLIVTETETGERGFVLIYIILLSDRAYQLGFTSRLDRFEEMAPIFDTSASTFRINP